jgi:hypothetical protein
MRAAKVVRPIMQTYPSETPTFLWRSGEDPLQWGKNRYIGLLKEA